MDILLDATGDILLNQSGDIVLGNSISQKIKIKLLWFLGEWIWDIEKGLPYYEELFVKNPDTDSFAGIIREAIFEVDEVTEVVKVEIAYDFFTRMTLIKFVAKTDEEIIQDEVKVYG